PRLDRFPLAAPPFAAMKMLAGAVAALTLLATSCFAAEGTSETPIATGTLAGNMLNAGSNWLDTQWVLFCGYRSCGDGGGGKLHAESCTADAIFCFADSKGHTFRRAD